MSLSSPGALKDLRDRLPATLLESGLRLIKTAVVFCAAGFVLALHAQTVRFAINEGGTPAGNIDVTLRPDVAPMTVANFLSYLNAGAYNNTIIHRSVPQFVIQAGGYQLINGAVVTTPTNAPITNEYNLSNTEGTIAMAQSSCSTCTVTAADSATSQWFFNSGTPGNNGTAAANALSLNGQQFVVFGSITAQTGSPNGLALMTAINNLPVFTEVLPGLSADGDFADIPLVNGYVDGATIVPDNFVLVSSVVVLPVPSQLGVLNAASSAAALTTGIAPGELLTIYGQNNLASLGPATGVSYSSSPVSTTLGNTQVFFNNIPGPMLYSSSGQVNVVVPYGIFNANAAEVTVVVQYNGVQSEPLVYRPLPVAPGIFTLNGYGTGDAAVVDNTTGTVIQASNPASVGEILALFGTGQGVSTTATALADGVVVGSTLPYPAATVTLLIDGQTVTPLYAGGAPGDVNGVLQVDFRVPQIAAGAHQIQLQMVSGGTTYTSPTGVNLQTK